MISRWVMSHVINGQIKLHDKADHLNYGQVRVCNSNVSNFQRAIIQILTVQTILMCSSESLDMQQKKFVY